MHSDGIRLETMIPNGRDEQLYLPRFTQVGALRTAAFQYLHPC